MGYESKLYFVDKGFSQHIVATLDMGKTGWLDGFVELFDKPFKSGLFIDMAGMALNEDYTAFYRGEEIDYLPDYIVHEDMYGAELRYAEIDEVYNWLEEHKNDENVKGKMTIPILKALIDSFRNEEWQGKYYDLCIVNFGH